MNIDDQSPSMRNFVEFLLVTALELQKLHLEFIFLMINPFADHQRWFYHCPSRRKDKVVRIEPSISPKSSFIKSVIEFGHVKYRPQYDFDI